MDNQKFNLILDKLLEKTEQNKLQWEKTAARNTLLVVLNEGAISIIKEVENGSVYSDAFGFGNNSYIFNFRDEMGNIVESVKVANDSQNKPEQIFELQKAQRIFDLAQGQVDKTVDRILEQLAA